MKSLYECLVTEHATAFFTAIGIVLITIFLVSKRIIGFTFSLILILIALGAALAIDNQETVRAYVNEWTGGVSATKETPAAPGETQEKAPSTDKLRGQTNAQKEKVQAFIQTSEKAPAIDDQKTSDKPE